MNHLSRWASALVLTSTLCLALTKTPSVTITPGNLAFGTFAVGVNSPVQTVTVKNVSAPNVVFSSVTVYGSSFRTTKNTCAGASLTPNGTCAVSISFNATSEGAKTGTLVFTNNAVNSPQIVSMLGSGIILNAAPTVSAGSNQSITLPANAKLIGTVTDDGLPNHSLSQQWTQVSGPGTVTFSNPQSAGSAATFPLAGTYVLRLTATDGELLTSADTTVTVASAASTSALSAVWANEGEDKVSQDELRATKNVENSTGTVHNRVWDGTGIQLAAARNEVVSFNLVLEAANAKAENVSVSFDTLTGDNGFSIASVPATGDGVFDWTKRNIELFYARYVPIKGLSFFGYFKGDERQIPTRFQAASHVWTDRPDHDKFYPDALVPLELMSSFPVAQGQNQSIWSDVYVPKSAPPGNYTGVVKISENGVVTKSIPVTLTVAPFVLPDSPAAKTFVNLDPQDIIWRFIAPDHHYVQWNGPDGARAVALTDKYVELFHRHKIGVITENDGPTMDRPQDVSLRRLDGSLFTAANGYDGPGVATPNDIYSIGTYGTWGSGAYGIPYWKNDQSLFNGHIDAWQSWFEANAPNVEHFIYLADEPSTNPCNGSPNCTDIGQVQNWASWVNQDPGPGKNLVTMSTYNAVMAQTLAPDLDAPTLAGGIGGCPAGQGTCDTTAATQAAVNTLLSTPNKRFWMYNDGRPGTGTFDTEDDGISPRTLPWAQMKMGVQRWYYWFANVSCCGDYFQNAVTWGNVNRTDGSIGQTGDDGTSNGNGLLVYPGSDLVNPQDNYGVNGPIASLRMKSWRRGIQDADYIAIARTIDPAATNAIVNAAIPKALWENPAPGGDPSFFNGPISWSVNPDDWEIKRAELAAIITHGCQTSPAASYCQ